MLRRFPKQKVVVVRVEETSDGLIIHPDDARNYGLNWDQPYKGRLTRDGFFRIALPQASSKPKGTNND